MVPVDTLPSKKTVPRALYGIFDNNMKNYQDSSEKNGCIFLKDASKAKWKMEKGCCENPSPCLLYQVTEKLA